MRLFTSLVAVVAANHKADNTDMVINNPIAQFAPVPAAVTEAPTAAPNTTRTMISHSASDELVDVLNEEQTMRLLEQFNADGVIGRKEKQLILKISKEKRRLSKAAAKREREQSKALGRKKRQPSKCEENLPLIDNGRWLCNGKTESCMLECEPLFLRNV